MMSEELDEPSLVVDDISVPWVLESFELAVLGSTSMVFSSLTSTTFVSSTIDPSPHPSASDGLAIALRTDRLDGRHDL